MDALTVAVASTVLNVLLVVIGYFITDKLKYYDKRHTKLEEDNDKRHEQLEKKLAHLANEFEKCRREGVKREVMLENISKEMD